jgi:hypothetical protein
VLVLSGMLIQTITEIRVLMTIEIIIQTTISMTTTILMISIKTDYSWEDWVDVHGDNSDHLVFNHEEDSKSPDSTCLTEDQGILVLEDQDQLKIYGALSRLNLKAVSKVDPVSTDRLSRLEVPLRTFSSHKEMFSEVRTTS